ncbi:6-phosphogluconolactonase [Candidatus Neomarinimicrobiota bacterium]
MEIKVFKDRIELSEVAASQAAAILKSVIDEKGSACFIVATGESQIDFLRVLAVDDSIDWRKTKMYHLDEYVGISSQHSASFRSYLMKRLIERVHPGEVHLVNGENPDPESEAQRLSDLISRETIDVAFVGVGENGHLAFNDPPADFETDKPFIVVDLDTKCRQQQVNEGWFPTIHDVPPQAITMSINQIMKSSSILAVVPGLRKAEAVRNCFINANIYPGFPSSILKKHPNAFLYLDTDSASLLEQGK